MTQAVEPDKPEAAVSPDEKPAEATATSASPEPTAASPPEIEVELLRWVKSARTLELLSLPFDNGNHLSDLYDVALMTLMKRRWTLGRLRWAHYLVLSPVLEFPFWRPPLKIGWTTLVGRFMAVGLMVYGLFLGLNRILVLADYGNLLPGATMILAGGLVTLHLFLAGESFRRWRDAYGRVHHHAPAPPRKAKRRKKIA